MKIVAAGGGSGGHVTPALTVINELKQTDSQLETWFICDRGYAAPTRALVAQADLPISVRPIFAGKYRRYHGQSGWQRLLDLATWLRNLRDIAYLAIGLVQSLRLLAAIRPDVVFTKGGFVCVPVGLAAAVLKIPLVVHDSDTLPGLTNRLLARYATIIATGASLEHYNYPAAKSHYVGIPVKPAFKPADTHQRASLKAKLGYAPDLPLVLVTGGGTGAANINRLIAAGAERLVERAQVVHLTGPGKSAAIGKRLAGYHVLEFIDATMADTVRAADVVVTRAGATTLLELAAAGAACIIVPNRLLVGGHQITNAEPFAKAAEVLDERQFKHKPNLLTDAILELLADPKRQAAYRTAIQSLARPAAARDLAALLREAAAKPKRT